MSQSKLEPTFLWWNSIGNLVNSEVGKFVSVIPLVGYLIIFNDKFSDALTFNTIAGVHADGVTPFFLDSPQKLRLAFFGSIFVVVSNLLFRAFAPLKLAQFRDDHEFVETVFNSFSRREIVEIEQEVIVGKWTFTTDHLRYFLRNHELEPVNLKPKISGFMDKAMMKNRAPDYLNALSREYWTGKMHSNRFLRFTTFGFGSLGYLMLALPTLDILQAVVLQTF